MLRTHRLPASLRRALAICRVHVSIVCLAAALPLPRALAQGLVVDTAPARSHEFREVHLGMEVRMVIVHASDEAARDLAARGFARIEVLEQIMSDWRPGSELNRLSAAPVGQWSVVSPELHRILVLADAVARATDGAFDHTVGPLTRLWREAARTGRPIPDSARVIAVRSVGYRYVEVDSESFAVRLLRPGMQLDLGAIAKGWILDDVARLLDSAGVKRLLLEAGGEIVTRGAPPGEVGWRIAVETSRGDTLITLNDAAVSTSASRAQLAPAIGGGEEGHVFRVSTGRGATDTPQITVIGRLAALTDALATAFALMPAEQRNRIAERFAVRIVDP